jgi:hypothetical protein
MKTLLTFLCLMLAGPAWASDADIASIKKQLAPFTVLKGGFKQEKKIKILRKPLKSAGSFILVKDKGLLWQSATPMPSLLRITRDEIAQLKDGKTKVFVSTKSQPGLEVVGKILFAVFAADVDELRRHFEFVLTSAPPRQPWKATLRPLDGNVAKVINSVQISGRKTVESLTLDEANGDSTVLLFLNVTDKLPATKAEAALFE